MSYQLNKTDGTLLTELIDGQIDDTSTNLTLVGRNYNGYGEAFNENFIKILENFANTAAPSNPLTGQTWWDKNEQRLKVYNGTQWNASGSPFVQPNQPQMVAGDLWIDNINNQLYTFDGSDLTLIGPQYTANQGQSGFIVDNVTDVNGRLITILSLYIRGNRVAVYSNDTFVPSTSDIINELITDDNPSGQVFIGVNVFDKTNYQFRGTASRARALVDSEGNAVSVNQFLPANRDGITVGALTIQNQNGLTIGASQNHRQFVESVTNSFVFQNKITDQDMVFRINSSLIGSPNVDAIRINSSNAFVGIFTSDPEYTLDVAGDLRVTGNLLIEGETTSLDITNLRVEDHQIELGVTDDSTLLADAAVNNGGIILKSLNGDKILLWDMAVGAWSSNVGMNLTNNQSYYINGIPKLTATSLDPTILSATGLTQIGTLVELNVDYINFNGSAITTNAVDLTLDTQGNNIVLNADLATKIQNLGAPEVATDAATKGYIDSQVIQAPLILSMDVSGLGTGATLINNVAAFLEDLLPAAPENNTKVVRIHATSYTNQIVTGINITLRDNVAPDAGETLTISRIAVDSNGTQNESVVQDIGSANSAAGSIALVPDRQVIVFESDGVSWNYQVGDSFVYP